MNKIDDSIIGHNFTPDWLHISGEVLLIGKRGDIYFWFVSGHKRWFSSETFQNHFTHDEECILCSEE